MVLKCQLLKQYASRHALVDDIETGVWVIKLGEFIPGNERWMYQHTVKEEIDEAIIWAGKNLPEESDIEKFTAKFEE